MFLLCDSCGAVFTEMEQTIYDYKNGVCPSCNGYNTHEINLGNPSEVECSVCKWKESGVCELCRQNKI